MSVRFDGKRDDGPQDGKTGVSPEEGVAAVRKMEALARRKHEGQVRKGAERLPYIVHPAAVVDQLKAWGYTETDDPVVIATAWGHDLIEDTDVRDEEILAACGALGDEVLSAIRALSFRPEGRLTDAEYDAAKAKYVAGVAQLAPDILVVKLADRLCNTRDFQAWKPERAAGYLAKGQFLFARLTDARSGEIKGVEAIRATYGALVRSL